MYSGCSTRDDDGTTDGIDNCLNFGDAQLKLTIQESFTSLPAKVSVFFKVNDTDGKASTRFNSRKF